MAYACSYPGGVSAQWVAVGNRGLHEYRHVDGRTLGAVHDLHPGQWHGWTHTLVCTKPYPSLEEAQAAVEQLLAVGAYPYPKPEPKPVRKQWRPVKNRPDDRWPPKQ